MTVMLTGNNGIVDKAVDAAGGDGELALLLVLGLIWSGRLRASRSGLQRIAA